VAAGVALAIVLSGDDDGEKTSASAPTTATQTATTKTTVTGRTEPVTPETATHDKQEIEQTVTTFVESAEQSDSQACSQVAGGEGKQLEGCAAAAGIDLRDLPSSDELQIDEVKVSGDHGKAELSNGSVFSLNLFDGKWKITGFKARRQPGSNSGGQGVPNGKSGGTSDQ
jgi:hypothetical protein